MRKEHRTLLIQILLFVVTFFTTTIQGAEWVYGKSFLKVMEDKSIGWNADFWWGEFALGLQFSIPFLLILTVHEFGHYFVAMYHKIKTTLPFYIPCPPLPLSLGTFGAVIRIKQKVRTNLENFDIGLAGPLAGFIVALGIIIYGFLTLPPAEAIFEIHPEYKQYGLNYADSVYTKSYMQKNHLMDIRIGTNLLYRFFENFVADESRVLNEHELMHSPLLLAGFFALFFTSMNLLPIGQLDGGHITYGLFGWKWHRRIATVFFIGLLLYAGTGMVSIHTTPRDSLLLYIPMAIVFYYFSLSPAGFAERDRIMIAVLIFGIQFVVNWLFPVAQGNKTWVVFGFLASRFAGIQHPPSEIEVPLDTKRVILGWVALIIFIISFSPSVIEIG